MSRIFRAIGLAIFWLYALAPLIQALERFRDVEWLLLSALAYVLAIVVDVADIKKALLATSKKDEGDEA